MADQVKIDFTSDTKALEKDIDLLEKLGQIDKKNADQFKNNTATFVDNSKKQSAAIKGTGSELNNLTDTLKNVGAAIGVAFGLQQVVQFGKESVLLAAKAEGIRTAFSKIGNDNTLERLRKATRGATSDIDLMAQALRANNFKIPLDLFAKGMELAGKVSRQTGQDVTYLADSFVNGLGRKSLLILDNLQISQVQLRNEIRKTGDFNTAVSNVIEAKLKDMGEVVDTTADKIGRLSAGWDNFKTSAGEALIAAGVSLVDFNDKITSIIEKDGGIWERFFGFGREESKLPDVTKRVQADVEEATAAVTKANTKSLNQLELELQNLKDLLGEIPDVNSGAFGETRKEIDILQAKIDELMGKENKKLKELAAAKKRLLEENQKNEKAANEEAIKDANKMVDDIETALKLSEQRKVLITQEGSQEKLDAQIHAVEAVRDFELKNIENTEQEKQNIIAESENKIIELRNKSREEDQKITQQFIDDQKKIQEKRKQDEIDFSNQVNEARINLASEAISALQTLNDQSANNQIAALQEQKDAEGNITQEAQDEIKQIKRKTAAEDKLLSIFNIALHTAEAVTKSIAEFPITFGQPFAGFAIASGLIQTALVAARPIPFAKGTKSVKGGQQGKDSVHALLMPDEMVFPVPTKRRYEPILNAIFDERISPDLLNSMALKGQMNFSQHNSIDEYTVAAGMKSALRNGIVVKNMPKNDGSISRMEFELLKRRGIA